MRIKTKDFGKTINTSFFKVKDLNMYNLKNNQFIDKTKIDFEMSIVFNPIHYIKL